MSSRTRAAAPRVAATAALAAAIVALLVVVSHQGAGSSGATTTRSGDLAGGARVEALLAGIPQDGISLGRRDAPVTVVEFADLKCPVCAAFSDQLLPELIDRYVRPGKVRLEFRAQHFVGEQINPGDSVAAARMALAAAQQDRLWHFVELFYANQQDESTRYATDTWLRRLGEATPGLDTDRALGQRGSDAVTRALAESELLFGRHGLTGTPSFLVDGRVVAPGDLPRAIDEALAR